ncbi:hypothetical protein GCM10022284_44070 [Streptomyces hundungensis]
MLTYERQGSPSVGEAEVPAYRCGDLVHAGQCRERSNRRAAARGGDISELTRSVGIPGADRVVAEQRDGVLTACGYQLNADDARTGNRCDPVVGRTVAQPPGLVLAPGFDLVVGAGDSDAVASADGSLRDPAGPDSLGVDRGVAVDRAVVVDLASGVEAPCLQLVADEGEIMVAAGLDPVDSGQAGYLSGPVTTVRTPVPQLAVVVSPGPQRAVPAQR